MTYGIYAAFGQSNFRSGFNVMPVGAGGFILTMDISPDGQMLITKDAGGANLWNSTTSKWDQLITASRMPATDVGVNLWVGGSYFAVSAPGNSSVIYLGYGAAVPSTATAASWVFKSTDRGQSFSRTTFSSVQMSTGGSYKFFSPKAAVDPANANILYIGVPPASAATTFSNGSAMLTTTNQLQVGEAVRLTTTGALPSGFATLTTYWVVASTPSTIQLSASRGGSAITAGSAGSGSHTWTSMSAYVTTDGGATWATVPGVPAASQAALGICFDPTSLVVGGKTQGIYLWSGGNGLYHSTNGGTSFSVVASSPSLPGGSVINQHGRISGDGTYYLCLGNDGGGPLWRLQSGVWTDITANVGASPLASVCCDPNPANSANVIAIIDPGYNFISTNHGATFTQGSVFNSRTATYPDVVWLQNTNEAFMSVGDICLDPLTANKLWFSEGVGVWYSTATVGHINDYTAQSRGIEELICNQVVAPPSGGSPMVVCWDRPVFTLTDLSRYPTGHGPNYTNQVQLGNAVDWATNNPQFLALLTDVSAQTVKQQSSYSTDGGLTWTLFPATPANATTYVGGNIAVSTSLKMVWGQGNDGDLYYTSDGGNTWTLVTAANFTTNGSTPSGVQNAGAGVQPGWCHAYFLKSFNVAADRQTTGVFYAHNWQSVALGGGTYKSVNGGATWIRQSTTLSTDNAATGFNVQLKTVPSLIGANGAGVGGLLSFTAGEGQSPFLWFSKNGGGTWSKAGTGAQQAGANFCHGFGAIKPGNDFPSVFFVGKVNNVYGIYRSDNSYADWTSIPNGSGEIAAIAWTLIGQFPLGNTDEIVAIDGDKLVWNQFYLGTSNSGFYWYKP